MLEDASVTVSELTVKSLNTSNNVYAFKLPVLDVNLMLMFETVLTLSGFTNLVIKPSINDNVDAAVNVIFASAAVTVHVYVIEVTEHVGVVAVLKATPLGKVI